MATVTMNVPDHVQAILGDGDQLGRVLRLSAAFSLCQRGELSTSQAADLAELSYGDFLQAAAGAQVTLFPFSMDELAEEITHGFTLGR